MKQFLLSVALGATAAAASAQVPLADVRARLPEDELIYFLLPDRFENGDAGNDRGGLTGDRLATGFDPTHKGFFHGGDLKGLTARLDYLKGMGITAVWLAPVFKNKPVQGPKGNESAGYHGYWVTDFTRGRSASWHQCRLQGAGRRGACARDEGLYGHHHQPHRRRDPVRRVRGQEGMRLSQPRRFSPTSAAAGQEGRRSTRASRGTRCARRRISRG